MPRRPVVLVVLSTLPLLAVLTACGGASSSATATEPGASASSPSAAHSSSTTTCDFVADGQKAAKPVAPPPATPTVSGTVPVTITTSVGTLSGTLDAAAAPCTVQSFVSLADQGFYDDTPCHRLTLPQSGIAVLQCGDPTGTGTGGPGYTIPDELTGEETYPPGTLAMAKTTQPNSGGSQFFVVYGKTPLPPSYTVFGKVSPRSVRVVRQVAAQGVDNAFGPGDGHPKEKVTITRVTTG